LGVAEISSPPQVYFEEGIETHLVIKGKSHYGAYLYGGLNQKLTGVREAHVLEDILL